MALKATNNFVFVIRDKTETEKSGLFIPGQGREKPHTGTIFSIGSLVRDKEIKGGKNKKALFHKGVGFEIEYDKMIYLVLEENQIIAIA